MEVARHALLLPARALSIEDHVVCAMEHGRGELDIPLPAGGAITDYNYIMTRRVAQGTLLAFLMRANHNNGTGTWKKLSVRLQRYLAR